MSSAIELKSSTLSASINLRGAEITRLTDQASGKEFMWSGDPGIWSGIAPVLFPIVGALKDETYHAKGGTYHLQRHGFARVSDFAVTGQSADQVQMTLASSTESLALYPWKFQLDIIFQLTVDALRVTYQVANQDSDTMLFNLGSHPAFRLPGVVSGTSAISDYAIRFNKNEDLNSYRLADNLILPERHLQTLDQGLMPLSSTIFDNDALIFLNIQSDRISLVKTNNTNQTGNAKGELNSCITVDTGGAPHLGIWAKPAAPYVCIEPWWGYADFNNSTGELSEKASIQRLDPGERFEHTLSILLLQN